MDSSRIYKTEAIILKRKNIGEADRILTIFTKEYGKLKVLAKGIRRITSRRSPHLEVFTYVRLMLHRGKTFDMVTEVETVETFQVLRRDLNHVSAGYYYCELIEKLLPEKQEHRDVFFLLVNAFRDLDAHRDDLPQIGVQFSTELVRCLGFLARDKVLLSHQVIPFIEGIAERKLKTPKFFVNLSTQRGI